MHLVIPLVLIVLVIAFGIAVSRGNELFLISIRESRLLVVRGRVPVALVQDFEDVVRRANIKTGVIRAVRASGHSRLLTSGIDATVAQRLRNAFGVHPVQRLQNAPPPANRNLGQVLGITALAWFLSRR